MSGDFLFPFRVYFPDCPESIAKSSLLLQEDHMALSRQFEGKVALVTGAASGIGKITAIAFADAGASVVVADIDVEKGRAVVEGIKSSGGAAAFVKCNVESEDDIANMVAQTVSTFGRLDCAYNNAAFGGALFSPLADIPNDQWEHTINVDLRGVWLCMKYEIQQMLKQGGGAIVNCASSCGLVAYQNLASYVAAKHGVVGLTKAAALDYATQNIRVNAVCPGTIYTEAAAAAEAAMEPEEWRKLMEAVIVNQPNGRLGKPEEIADAVLWLCSPGASLMLGHALAIDGGLTVR
jgi:NAD(P)-dependent dehydrogenase (short-subunit alcohol dehydrogenase family)